MVKGHIMPQTHEEGFILHLLFYQVLHVPQSIPLITLNMGKFSLLEWTH